MVNIKSYFLEKFNFQPEEGSKFSLLFFHSFFLGLFLAFYFVPANSEFIQHFGSQQLPIAYIVAGVVGYLSTLIYSQLQKKVSSQKLFIGALIFMLVIALLSRYTLFWIQEHKAILGPFLFKKYEKWLSFFVFIWAWPFISLVGTESGGLALRLLNLKQVKRYFGLINMGGVIASILGYLTIPLLLKILGHHFDLLFIGIIGIVIGLVQIIIIYKRFPENKKTKTEQITEVPRIKNLVKSKFYILIFVTAILSSIAIFVTDYGFLIAIKAQNNIFSDKEHISQFMALVFGGLKIGELIISLLSSRLLSKWGVRAGLTVVPAIITLLLVLAAFTGLTIGVATISFLMIMTANKSLERIFRRGLDDPAFNILYQTLPDNQKLYVQTRVGVASQLSIAIAGVVLFFISKLLISETDLNLEYFPFLVLPLVIAWLHVALVLYQSYKEKIKQILAEKRMFKISYTGEETYGSQVLEKNLLSQDTNAVKLSVVILSETNPASIEPYINVLLNNEDKIIRKAILKNIDPIHDIALATKVEQIGNDIGFKEKELRRLILQAIYHLDFSELKDISNDDLIKLSKSESTTDQMLLTKYLYRKPIKDDEQILLQLLDSKIKTIKLAAIRIAGKRDSVVLHKKLVQMLRFSEFSHVIGNVLIERSSNNLPLIEELFTQKSEPMVLVKAVEIIAKIGGKQAEELLISQINYPNRDVQSAIINGLFYCEYQASDNAIIIIKNKIQEIADNILWIFVSIKDLESKKNTLRVIQSLELERERLFNLLFNLLSFIYKPELIDLIKTNIIGKNTIFAIEIIENFIGQDIKQFVIPLVDKISVSLRIKKLSPFLKHKELGFLQRLRNIVLIDDIFVDSWTKAKAIELLGRAYKTSEMTYSTTTDVKDFDEYDIWTEEKAKTILHLISKEDIPDEVFVCLYHPDELIYSTAAKVLFDESPIRCVNYLKTLSHRKQKLIEVLQSKDPIGILAERVKLLKRIFLFFSVPEISLVKIAKLVKTIRKKKGEKLYFLDKDGREDIFIIIKGQLSYFDETKTETRYFKNDILIKGLNVPLSADFIEISKDLYTLAINRFDYFNLLVIDKDIIKHMFDRMKFNSESNSEYLPEL